MTRRRRILIALTIAGSDSGGGAGAQADLKTFAALGVHGTSALTCLTAQNPRGVRGVQAATPAMLRAQIEAVFEEFPPAACKTGLLCSASLIQIVVQFFREHRHVPLVVDPVMVATSGVRLLQPAAMKLLQRALLPLATLVTPNLDEAECILSTRLRSEEDLRHAARELHERFGCAALVKGGHLRGRREAVDIFFDGKTELLLSAPFVRGVSTHGTGCTYSAAITAHLALALHSGRATLLRSRNISFEAGSPGASPYRGQGNNASPSTLTNLLPQAVTRAKEFITQSIAQSLRAGRHDVLNPFWK